MQSTQQPISKRLEGLKKSGRKTRLRKEIAKILGIESESVRKMFLDTNFLQLLPKYQTALAEATNLPISEWENPATILVLDEANMIYSLVEEGVQES